MGEYTNDVTGKFRKGNPGRPEGATNKITRDIKEIHDQILAVIQDEITVEELIKNCKKEVILTYLAKTMPKDYNVNTNINPQIVLPDKNLKDV